MGANLKIGGACLNQTPFDWENNMGNILGAINQAKDEGIRILCLPELCITGYGCEDMFLSEWLPEKALTKLAEIVPETSGITVTVGLPVLFDYTVYNVTCIISDTRILGFYAKQKMARFGVHYEHRWFSPWEPGKVADFEFNGQHYPFGHITIQLHGLKVGFEICEDAWLENRPAAHPVNKNVDLFLNPSASHFAFGKLKFRENIVKRSSEKFSCTYLYTNLLGNEAGRMIFDGDIMIAQQGQLKGKNARLSFQNYKLLSCEIDFSDHTNSETKIMEEVESYQDAFRKATSLALFDYLRKSRSKGFVLSLSGGADSSTIAVMVAEMVRSGLEELGFEVFREKTGLNLKEGDRKQLVNQLLHTAYQGTVNSSEDTFLSAKELAESIGAQFYEWKIDSQIADYQTSIEKALGRKLEWETDDIALQNIQARARSPIIWMLANIKNALLLATSNRSEGDVGYATMDGDTSGSISPIAGVDKHFVLKWLVYAEKELGYSGLKRVNSLSPTAELRPQDMHQTDETDLMPYAVMVDIERKAIRERKSPKEVYDQLKESWPDHLLLKQWITRFFTLWARNQWKRERFAPSFHLDDFNVDSRTWCRFPILSGSFREELEELKLVD